MAADDGRKVSREEAKEIHQAALEHVVPLMRQLADRFGLNRCQALGVIQEASRMAHAAIHSGETDEDPRHSAPWN